MRLKSICLTLGLGMVASATAADAADWNRGSGSIKDRGGVAIPAPVPIPETFKWYLRADVGGGIMSGGDASTSGDVYGFDRDPAEGPAFGLRSSWFTGDFDTFAMGGVGVGAYFSPRIRGDVTVDFRSASSADVDARYSYSGDPAIYDPGNIGRLTRIDGHTKEATQVRSSVALANIYWDLVDRGNRFVPYVGAGVGFAIRSMDRRHETTEIGTDITDPDPNNQFVVVNRSFDGKAKTHQLAPAVAAMAGFTYNLNPGMVLDVGYRFTYIGAVDFSTHINFSQPIDGQRQATSRLTIDDTYEHALRAGIRWNVW